MALSAEGVSGSRSSTRMLSSASPKICRRPGERTAPARGAVTFLTSRCSTRDRAPGARTLSAAGRDLHGERRDAQRATDLVGQVGLVHRVEMQMLDPVRDQVIALLGSDGDRKEVVLLLGSRIAIGAQHPVGDGGSAAGGKAAHAAEILDGQNPGPDRNRDSCRRTGVTKTVEDVIVEEKLGDCTDGTGVDLALEIVDIGVRVRRLRVRLGIGADPDLEKPLPGQRLDQLDRACKAIRMRLESALSRRWIAAEGNNAAAAKRRGGIRRVENLIT